MDTKRLAYLVPILVCLCATRAGATLVMEPVIGFFPGQGPSADTFPLYDPTYVNEATGEQVSLARNPGEIDKWSMGYPREEVMMTFGMYNNTPTNITSLTMTIVGSSEELVEGVSWLVTPDPNVDARFGDANGDGMVGLSDTFATISVSNNGRTLTSTFRNFHPLRDYVAVQKMSSAAINSRARSSGRMARPRGPPLIHLSFQSDQ